MPQLPSPNNDRRLMLELLAHGELDLELLTTCLQGTAREELKSSCKEAQAMQREAREFLQSRMTEWHGSSSIQPAQLSEIKDEKRRLLRSLEPRSALPFESRLLLNLVNHDSEAVQQSVRCVSEAYRPELKQFCQQVAEQRRTTGRRAENWVCQWYRDCISRAFPPK